MKKLIRFRFSTLSIGVFTAQILLAFAFTCAFAVQLHAQGPKISIQGTLQTANGASVPDGAQPVTFKLYDVETAGTALWQENATVEVIGGIYSHYLGSVTPLIPANFATTLYSGLQIDSYAMGASSELAYSRYVFSEAVSKKVVCSGAVGYIKYSILNPTQFNVENGDCWVPMDGRALLATDKLRMITGMALLPDGGGLFLRSQEFSGGADNDPGRTSGSAIASLQTDDVKPHDHTMNSAGTHSHPMGTRGFEGDGLNGADGSGDDQDAYTQNAGAHTHTINNSTGSETRPKNLNFWIYIRIN